MIASRLTGVALSAAIVALSAAAAPARAEPTGRDQGTGALYQDMMIPTLPTAPPSASPTGAQHRLLIQGISINDVPQEPIADDDLPKPPTLAAPQVPQAGKIMDSASPHLAQNATNGSAPSPAKKKPLKLK